MPRVGDKHFSYTAKGKKAAQRHAKKTKQTVESMYGGRLFSLLTESDERRQDRGRRETIDNYIKSRRLEASWANRTRRVQKNYSGPDQRKSVERRNPDKPKSKTSLSDIEKVLSNYSNQRKR
mgnify:CR=1 FL=1